ncbi:MAG: glycosyltransferase family 2 protein [Nitratireductor sp.]
MAGGWDAYNVTEDADLGIRLARMGYKCGTITLPTYEEAPEGLADWLPQRTRWLKGWMQTFFVHMRSHDASLGKFNLRNYFLLHMVLTSIVISIIIHPFFLIAFLVLMFEFATNTSNGIVDTVTLAISTFTLSAGYLTYGFLALAVTKNRAFAPNRLWILALPIYWLFISLAGWRAMIQLIVSPHKWEKTTHGNTKRSTPTL